MTQRKGIDHEFLSKERERERAPTATRHKRRRKKERMEESKVWQNAWTRKNLLLK
jgi:hypothetical protein